MADRSKGWEANSGDLAKASWMCCVLATTAWLRRLSNICAA